jgi:lipoate-protein ligase A
MYSTSDYNLPDIDLLKKKSNQFLIWIPDKVYIVLGASNKPADALNMDNVARDNITVLRRPSGGQTVILTPNNVLIAAVFFGNKTMHPKEVFQQINKLIISAIEETGIHNLIMMGISDIAISNKKILGSAIYRSKTALLYHAVLNLGEPASTFERYLKHPSKEPDYRQGRSHTEFVTSLKENGYTQSSHHLTNELSLTFERSFGVW